MVILAPSSGFRRQVSPWLRPLCESTCGLFLAGSPKIAYLMAVNSWLSFLYKFAYLIYFNILIY